MEESETSLKSHLNRFVKSYASSIDFLPLWAAHCDGFTASKLQDVQISLDFDKLNAPTLHQLPPPPLLSAKHLFRRGLQVINDYIGGREVPENYTSAFQRLDTFLKNESDFLPCLQKAKRQDRASLATVLTHHLLSKLVPHGSCCINRNLLRDDNRCLCGQEVSLDTSSTAVGVKSLWHGCFDVMVANASALVFEDSSSVDEVDKMDGAEESSEPPAKRSKTSAENAHVSEKNVNSKNCTESKDFTSTDKNGSGDVKSQSDGSVANTSSEDGEKSKVEESAANKVTNIKSLFQIKSPNPSLCGNPNIRRILGQCILNAIFAKKNNPALVPLVVPTLAFTGTEFIVYLYNSAVKMPFDISDVMLYSRCLDLTSKSHDGTQIPQNVVILLWLILNFDLFGNPIPQPALFEIVRRQYLFGFRRDTGPEIIKYETEIKRSKDLEIDDPESSAINFSLVRNIAQPLAK